MTLNKAFVGWSEVESLQAKAYSGGAHMLAWPSSNSCHLWNTSDVPDRVLGALRGLARLVLLAL